MNVKKVVVLIELEDKSVHPVPLTIGQSYSVLEHIKIMQNGDLQVLTTTVDLDISSIGYTKIVRKKKSETTTSKKTLLPPKKQKKK